MAAIEQGYLIFKSRRDYTNYTLSQKIKQNMLNISRLIQRLPEETQNILLGLLVVLNIEAM